MYIYMHILYYMSYMYTYIHVYIYMHIYLYTHAVMQSHTVYCLSAPLHHLVVEDDDEGCRSSCEGKSFAAESSREAGSCRLDFTLLQHIGDT